MRELDLVRTMSNNELEKQETNISAIYREEGCEIHAITRANAKEVEQVKRTNQTTDQQESRRYSLKLPSKLDFGSKILEANMAHLPKEEKDAKSRKKLTS